MIEAFDSVVKSYEEDIEELHQEIERLRKALETIKEHAKQRGYHMWDTHTDYYLLAVAALEGK